VTARATTCSGNLVVQSYLDRLLAEVPGAAAEIAQTPELTSRAGAEIAQTPAPTSRADLDHTSLDVADHHARVMPAAYGNEEWRAEPFQALLFRVQTVQFAAPLIRLHGVVPWSEEIADLPDTPPPLTETLCGRPYSYRSRIKTSRKKGPREALRC